MKNDLLQSFVSDLEIISEISAEHRNIIDYLMRKDNNLESVQDVLEETIRGSFFDEILGDTKQELISQIEEYDYSGYIDSLVDIYTNDLISSLHYFGIDDEISTEDTTLSDVIKRVQAEGYIAYYICLKDKFAEYLAK